MHHGSQAKKASHNRGAPAHPPHTPQSLQATLIRPRPTANTARPARALEGRNSWHPRRPRATAARDEGRIAALRGGGGQSNPRDLRDNATPMLLLHGRRTIPRGNGTCLEHPLRELFALSKTATIFPQAKLPLANPINHSRRLCECARSHVRLPHALRIYLSLSAMELARHAHTCAHMNHTSTAMSSS